MRTERRNPLVGLLALIAVLLLGFVGVGYAMGWIEFRNQADRTTIEFDKEEAATDTEYAVERTEEFITDTGESLKEAGSSLKRGEDTSPGVSPSDEGEREASTP